MNEDYKFYMSRYDKASESWEEEVELTEKFKGLIYCQCEGIMDFGAIKNLYTEEYAEADTLRVYLPENPKREATDIKLTVVFNGQNRRDVFDSFVEYITGKQLKYWDNVRNREVEMIQSEKISVDEDIIYGSSPYIAVEFAFTNVKGYSTKKV